MEQGVLFGVWGDGWDGEGCLVADLGGECDVQRGGEKVERRMGGLDDGYCGRLLMSILCGRMMVGGRVALNLRRSGVLRVWRLRLVLRLLRGKGSGLVVARKTSLMETVW